MKHVDLKNKNVFLSGATGDIGSEIAIKLAEEKCNLIINARDEKKLKTLSNKLSDGNQVSIVPGDISDIKGLSKIITEVKKIANVDILVNSAGIFPNLELKNTSDEELQKTINVNLIAPFIFMREFSKEMIDNNWGRIINIGSSSSYSGFKNTSAYCATKHAILGLSRSIHDELKEYNVRTYCISPSSAQSKMGEKSVDQDFSTFLDPKDIADFISYAISFDSNLMIEEILLKRLYTK
tara:strand:- start:1067 stop:1780 length:714 start_codon:yes stop_codon:yes gene_type:complete